MMGTQAAPARLFYDFSIDDHVSDDHLLRQIDRFLELGSVRLIWGERSTLSCLLNSRVSEIEVSMMISRTAERPVLESTCRLVVPDDQLVDPEGLLDLESAMKFVGQYWAGFCREAGPWLIECGISKLVIVGTIPANDLLGPA
jgi:hypothetical protein